MIDLQTVFPQEIIRINDVQPFPDDAHMVRIIGEDFSSVESITFNGRPSPSFFIIDFHHLDAELPEGFFAAMIQEVTVTSARLVLTEESILKFKLGKRPGKTTGIMKLVQLFVKVLLTTPGTDIFRKNTGGGAMRNLGQNTGKDGGNLPHNFVIAVQRTTRQIIASQATQPSLAPSERLLNAEVTQSQFNALEGTLAVTVQLYSHAGKAALANLVVNHGSF